MAQIELNTKVIQNPEVVQNEIDGEVVIMSLAKNKFYGIDKIGSAIWKLIEQPIQVESIIEEMTKIYKVDLNECKIDVIEFFENALKNDLIKIVE